MIRAKLFGETPTLAQRLIVGAWYLNILLVLVLWQRTSWTMFLHGGPGGFYVGIGQLLGLMATVFALTQFLLMGRVHWLERNFGMDHLASYHRINGYLTIIAIILHPIFITIGYMLNNKTSFLSQYSQLLFHYNHVIGAAISEVLFLLVVVSSIYLVRKHLKFENWYFVHLAVYVAILFVFAHQFAVGQSFVGHPLARAYWAGVYIFVLLNVLIWRFILPTARSIFFKFEIAKVVSETPTTTSVYIKMRNFKHWKSRPGQFVLVRIFASGRWWQEHPFSMSMIPHDGMLRLTIRHSGDYTNTIGHLKPGKRVLLSGPYGRFTSELAQTDKRLFIAGGVGITPLRSMAEEALRNKIPSTLIYANRTPDDIALKAEIAELTKRGLEVIQIFSDPPAGYTGERGYVDGKAVQRLVKDFKDRDVYLCGPPPMMTGVISGLTAAGIMPGRLHFENFSLHN